MFKKYLPRGKLLRSNKGFSDEDDERDERDELVACAIVVVIVPLSLTLLNALISSIKKRLK